MRRWLGTYPLGPAKAHHYVLLARLKPGTTYEQEYVVLGFSQAHVRSVRLQAPSGGPCQLPGQMQIGGGLDQQAYWGRPVGRQRGGRGHPPRRADEPAQRAIQPPFGPELAPPRRIEARVRRLPRFEL